jgi:flavin-binding protein dodecin
VIYDEHLTRQYLFWRIYIEQVIYRYLDCGNLHSGFVRPGDLDPYWKPYKNLVKYTTKEAQMSISRTTEIKSSSTLSFDDAMKKGIARTLKTLKNVRGAWIENQEVLIDEKGKISEYRIRMKVTFILEE